MSYKLCLNTQKEKYAGVPEREQVRIIAHAGFAGIHMGWSEQAEDSCALAQSLGLTLQSIHAPNGHTELLWEEWQIAKILIDEWCDCIRGSAALGAPIVVLHPFRGIGKEGIPTARGIEHFGAVVETAEKYGVRIAVENCEGARCLDALLNAYADCPHVGFCWDTGHEKCYNWGEDMMAGRSHRLIAMHLNDNLGVRKGVMTSDDDLHLLPFDGITDWQSVAHRLRAVSLPEFLALEVKKRERYHDMTMEAFVREAYRRAERIAEMI